MKCGKEKNYHHTQILNILLDRKDSQRWAEAFESPASFVHKMKMLRKMDQAINANDARNASSETSRGKVASSVSSCEWWLGTAQRS